MSTVRVELTTVEATHIELALLSVLNRHAIQRHLTTSEIRSINGALAQLEERYSQPSEPEGGAQ